MKDVVGNTGMTLPENYTEEQFLEAGRFLAKIEHGLQWATGDWYNAIKDKDKRAACERVGLKYESARKYGEICSRFPLGRRLPSLGFSHHQTMACMIPSGGVEQKSGDFVPTEEPRAQAMALLKRAVEGEWTVSRLRAERDKVMGKDEKVRISFTDKVEAVLSTLPKSASRKTKRAIGNVMGELEHQYSSDVEKEVKKRVAEERARLSELRVLREKELAKATAIRRGVDAYLTQDEFNFIRNCLHPDKQPEDRRARYAKAFDLFSKLIETINPDNSPQVRQERGWDSKAA